MDFDGKSTPMCFAFAKANRPLGEAGGPNIRFVWRCLALNWP
jgi:hypothetical protein